MERQIIERKLTTILSADVVGYSTLMRRDEAGTLAALKKNRRELLDPKASQYRGRTIKLMGDGALMEFGSVVDALLFAIEVQCAMRAQNADVADDQRIVYRVGINIGDIIVEGEDIYGDGVNIAARLEGLAEPGGICVSRTVFNHVRGKVDLTFDAMGENQVKNIPEPVLAYRVVLDEKADALVTPVAFASAGNRLTWQLQLAALLIAVAVGSAGLLWWQPWAPDYAPASVNRMAFALPDDPSVAILPFNSMSDDSSQDYFADGITEDLITDLSKVSGLFVISRNSTFVYKDKPVEVRQVAEDLGVRYVVEGSVRRVGDDVRINAQLIDALSGYHLWADRYDGSLADIFGLQDEVVGQIVSALAINIELAQSPDAVTPETTVAEAYDAFLEGWDHYRRQTKVDALAAIGFFQRAIELDPDYGRAYAGMAATYWLLADAIGVTGTGLLWQETFDLAKDYLARALLRPTSTAYVVSAGIAGFEGKIEAALSDIDKAIAFDPNNADSYVVRAQVLINSGKFAEAEQSARLAMRMNPHYEPHYLEALGRAQFYRGRYDEAVKTQERIILRQPGRKVAYMRLAAAYGHLGRQEEAEAAIARYNELAAKTGYTPLTVQEVGLWYEDTFNFSDKRIPEAMFDGLRKAGVPEGAAAERNGFDFKALVRPTYGGGGRSYEVDGVETIDAATAKQMLERGVLIVDVRDAGNYGRGHIPGAVNLDLNLALTEERLSSFVDKSEPVVFHCWGESCSYSAMACAKARLWGYEQIYYFASGFPAWKAAGYPIEATDDGG